MTDRADSPQFTALDAGRGNEHGNEDRSEDIHDRLDRLESLVDHRRHCGSQTTASRSSDGGYASSMRSIVRTAASGSSRRNFESVYTTTPAYVSEPAVPKSFLSWVTNRWVSRLQYASSCSSSVPSPKTSRARTTSYPFDRRTVQKHPRNVFVDQKRNCHC